MPRLWNNAPEVPDGSSSKPAPNRREITRGVEIK